MADSKPFLIDIFVLLSDDPRRAAPIKKKFFGSMGSILSKLKSHSNACEPTEEDEYSDGEDVIIIQKYKKSDLAASRIQQINDYRQDMDAANIKSIANRPPPGLIPKNKWSRVPDLQKMVPPRTQRVNGYQCENDTSTTRNCLVNGNSLSFKPQNGQQYDNTLSRNFSNYINSAVNWTLLCVVRFRVPHVFNSVFVIFQFQSNFGPKFTTFNPSKPLQTTAAADKQRYEKLLKSVLPDYVQSLAGMLSQCILFLHQTNAFICYPYWMLEVQLTFVDNLICVHRSHEIYINILSEFSEFTHQVIHYTMTICLRNSMSRQVNKLKRYCEIGELECENDLECYFVIICCAECNFFSCLQ